MYPVYTLYGPDFSRRVVLMRFGTIEEVERAMRAAGARTLVVGGLRKCEETALERRLAAGGFVPVSGRVYRLREAP